MSVTNWVTAEPILVKTDQGCVLSNCWMCGTPTKKTCANCKVRRYCSPICQKWDWARHKQECQDFQQYGLANVDMNFKAYVRRLEHDLKFRRTIFRCEKPEDVEEFFKTIFFNKLFYDHVLIDPPSNGDELSNRIVGCGELTRYMQRYQNKLLVYLIYCASGFYYTYPNKSHTSQGHTLSQTPEDDATENQ